MSDDRTVEIQQQMREIRSALRADATSIVENAKLTVDWRHYVERYPWVCVAAAAAIGYWIVPRRSPSMSMDKGTMEEIAERVKLAMPGAATKEQSKGLLMGVAGVALPLLAKVAAQGGMSYLQRHFFTSHENPPQPEPQQHKTAPRQSRPR